MTRRQIDAARERRLWIKDVIVPVVYGGIALMCIPGVRENVKEKTNRITRSIKERFKKK